MGVKAGVHKLRSALLLYFIGIIIVLIGIFAGGGLSLLSGFGTQTAGLNSGQIGGIVIYLVADIIGLVLGIIGIFITRSGFTVLKRVDKSYGIGATGALLMLIGLALVVVTLILLLVIYASIAALSTSSSGAAAILPIGILASLAAGLAVIGAILAFVGLILTMVGFWRIGSKYNNGLIKAGAILYFLITIIGAILLYIGLGEVEKAG